MSSGHAAKTFGVGGVSRIDQRRRISSSSNPNECLICCLTQEFFCVGKCGHAVCFECGVRMRVLCEQNECSICRLKLPEIFMTTQPLLPSSKLVSSFIRSNDGNRFGIRFENEAAVKAYQDITAHYCTTCKDEPTFRNFIELERHVKREHNLFYCELCVKHLRLFSIERKCYNRADLAKHRRVGDEGDNSYKGHPACTFCDQRFMDNDHLYKHLRLDHFYCHFCDADGENKFYDDYPQLMEHFGEKHYLCTLGDCPREQFTHAFRSDMDLKGHQTKMHGKKNNQVSIDITYSNGPTTSGAQSYRGGRGGYRGRGSQRGGGGRFGVRNQENSESQQQQQRERQQHLQRIRTAPSSLARQKAEATAAEQQKQPPVQPKLPSNRDFPTLDGRPQSGGAASQQQQQRQNNLSAAYASRNNARLADLNQFPSLSGEFEAATSHQTISTPRQDYPSLTDNHDNADGQSDRAKFVLIDDDEVHRNAAHAYKAEQERKRLEAERRQAMGEPEVEEDEEEDDQPSLYQSMKNAQGVWSTSGSMSLSHVAATLHSEHHFPSLAGETAKPKNQAAAIQPPSSTPKWVKPSGAVDWKNNSALNRRGGGGNQIVGAKLSKQAMERLTGADLVAQHKPSAPARPTSNENMISLKPTLVPKKRQPKKTEKENDNVTGNAMESSKPSSNGNVVTNAFNDLASGPPPGLDWFDGPPPGFEQAAAPQPPQPDWPGLPSSTSSAASTPRSAVSSSNNNYKNNNNNNKKKNDNNDKMKNIKSSKTISILEDCGPPPGFEVNQQQQQHATSAKQANRPLSNANYPSLVAANTTQQHKPVSTNLEYERPSQFDKRNESLFGWLQSCLRPDDVQLFKVLSKQYRKDEISAVEYYDHIKQLIPKRYFNQLYSELLVLLPDINKQQSLLAVHCDRENISNECSTSSGKSVWGTSTTSAPNVRCIGDFWVCQTCSQVLNKDDSLPHTTHHQIGVEYPSLG